jgi:anhydro-N-acetylmuramic acid kinase
MSGTSLDGLDLILSRFYRSQHHWKYIIHKAVTYNYTADWKKRLNNACMLKAGDFLQLHNEYGKFIGNAVLKFLRTSRVKADLVASHGHTIFHQPKHEITFQLGSGAAIASKCRVTTVSDFRSLDIAFGGQGAPLVPVGDELLFHDYRFCLNLGGFANISNKLGGLRIACDLCPVNIVINELALRTGHEFDPGGVIGSRGKINNELLNELNRLDFYCKPAPKSLGREWVKEKFMPVLGKYEIPVEDLIRSVYEHIIIQISKYVNMYDTGEILATGGGVFNTFLIELLQQKIKSKIIIPGRQLIKFKEALIFAFLGLLRYRNEINCLSSVTGATCDTSSGVINYFVNNK